VIVELLMGTPCRTNIRRMSEKTGNLL